ncbi:two component transcriptional regulator, LytTR family [Algoriphagus faecimaris]|uniref:Two component transcriptional regulator, LytTR family n=1 Tax=Algoriphagus faecimaris TaxID=686796 RepID=A0A1G6U911_9BACT|nr:LytTR family DNA-binding domain-containing protein [Algoriphagus faecimaris]SDD37793.1 two component transcriptional regulator, LytTR family [Algoriphagus faecimaris]
MNQKSLKIGIVDDEKPSIEILKDIISGIPFYEVIFSTHDPFQVQNLIDRFSIDILFMDIEMPGFNGLELARRIQRKGIAIIICSAYPEYAVDSFKIDAIYFIIKAPDLFEVSIALDKARKFLENRSLPENDFSDKIMLLNLRRLNKQVLLRTMDILYIEQSHDYSLIYLDSGEVIKRRSTFSETLKTINKPFIFKVHRSFAVNGMKINSFDHAYCYFKNEKRIPIGKDYQGNILNFLK